MMKKAIWTTLILLAGTAVSARADSVVYNNTGPSSLQSDGFTITANAYSVADSFTLASPVIIDAISFGDWVYSGDSLTSVEWEISSQPYAEGTVYGLGTVTSFASTYEGSLNGTDIYTDEFSISPLSLNSGTYYLAFMNGTTVQGYGTFWDEGDNPASTPYQWTPSRHVASPSGSETFELIGSSSSAVPEPSSLLLLGSGMAAATFILRRKLARV